MNKLVWIATTVLGCALIGCSSENTESEQEPEQEELESTESALRAGCSTGQIRAWQGACREYCGGRSRGIHACWDGMSASQGYGNCACY